MKKGVTLVLFILAINLASAYIDPGTGGYLATSLGGYILTFLAIFFAAVGTFISKYFSTPIKKFFKKVKRYLKRQSKLLFGDHRRPSNLRVDALVSQTRGKSKKWKYFLAGLMVLILIGFIYLQILDSNKIIFDESLSGAHIYDSEKIYPGYNLFEGKLIDMQGKVVKNWSSVYLGVFDDEGNYYAQKCFECDTWGKYTWEDKVIWEKKIPIHHEIVLKDDSVFTFTKEVKEYNGRDVEFDVILEFDKNGTFKSSFSLWDNLEMFKQFHKPLELDRPPSFFIPEDHKKNKSIWGGEYDYYHLNAMSFLPPNALENFTINNSVGREIKPFQEGNWLISFRHGSMLFILDKDSREVVWRINQFSIEDEIQGQHAPWMLPDGTILIFDNGRYREWSRVIAINPINLDVVWEYKSDDFYTLSQGYVQFLRNGNLIITEAEEGRVFEMIPQKEIVWEFYHPDKQNENNSVAEDLWGKRQQIYRMTRYDKNFIDSLRWN